MVVSRHVEKKTTAGSSRGKALKRAIVATKHFEDDSDERSADGDPTPESTDGGTSSGNFTVGS